MEERLDKTVFKKQSREASDNNTSYWRTRSFEERLQAAYYLSLRAYGYDPADPPRMDKQFFQKRSREEKKN